MKKVLQTLLLVAYLPFMGIFICCIAVYAFVDDVIREIKQQVWLMNLTQEERKELHNKLMGAQGCPNAVIAKCGVKAGQHQEIYCGEGLA